MLGALLAAGAAAFTAHAMLVAPRRLRVTRIDASIRDLPAALDGYTIAALGDLHHGSVLSPTTYVRRAIDLAHAERPDLIALLGDYALSDPAVPGISRRAYERSLRALTPLLGSLRARDGIVAVLGNHDYDYDAAAVAGWLGTLGIRVLVNDCIRIARGTSELVVGGVDDYKYGAVDWGGGCGAAPAGVPRIVLSHNPDAVLALEPDTRVDLILSGHTHGGQVVLPWIGALARHSSVCGARSASGWVPNPRGAPLYVTTGVGVVLPVRVRCPPEVLIVRLRAAE
ncbi:MAG TPA: metallophosphoesterase [Gemmatimonadaceae bacterium]